MTIQEQRFMERLPTLFAENNKLLRQILDILKEHKDGEQSKG